MDDVLTPFFYNPDKMVVLAALDVYVRRAYRAYDLRDVIHVVDDASGGLYLTEWRFRFPDHPNESARTGRRRRPRACVCARAVH